MEWGIVQNCVGHQVLEDVETKSTHIQRKLQLKCGTVCAKCWNHHEENTTGKAGKYFNEVSQTATPLFVREAFRSKVKEDGFREERERGDW